MLRIIIGLIAFILSFLFGYFGLPLIYHYAPSYGVMSIIILMILLGIGIVCLDRPVRDFIEREL